MPDESTDGIAYLMALKKSASPASGSASAPAVDRNPPGQVSWGGIVGTAATAAAPGAEKRRSPRYKCEGSIELREEGCDVRTWATFTDISLHGCYVEAQATYPAGTNLHLKLEVSGFRVETKGTVRVNYPYLGMGIAFVDMSEDNRVHLRELLCSISQPSMIMGPGIASSLPANAPLAAMPPITQPQAAIQALMEFFESRQMLMREDFLRILRSSQPPK